MALRSLDNASWGFESNCFVCEPANPHGLRIPFFHDDESGIVTAEFRLGSELSGAPHYVHGGVLLAILDEAMAWAAIALAGRFAVVRETTTTFEHGVRLGHPHRVEARVESQTERILQTSARVLNADGRRCARSKARLVFLTESGARSAIGQVGGEDSRYLRRRRERT